MPEDARPCFRVFLTPTRVLEATHRLGPGVWYFGLTRGRRGTILLHQRWVCTPLFIDGVTADHADANYGRLLRFRNTGGRWRQWAMPMALLGGSGEALREALLGLGVEIDPDGRALLARYLQTGRPDHHLRCVTQAGWVEETLYVTPTRVYAPTSAQARGVIFQGESPAQSERAVCGSLTTWQEGVAALAVNNPLLMLGLAAAFAGPLLRRCHAESGGLHFFGGSSTGKTTILEVACSVWGGTSWRRSWRATTNGLEGAAQLCNDGLMVLDEIGECAPQEVGAIVYMLGNNVGKQRATRGGQARPIARFRTFVLSSGEQSLTTIIQEGGGRARVGQGLRLLDLPVARPFGAWDCLHGFDSGTTFSDHLKRTAQGHFGHAGDAFLRRLVEEREDLAARFGRIADMPAFSAATLDGQERRGAARFALIALAGELAIAYGILPWAEGAALGAAVVGFDLWCGERGRGHQETRKVSEQLAEFVARHGESRFSPLGASGALVRDRAGWWRDEAEPTGRVYLFTSAGLREALRGWEFRQALQLLKEAGVINLDAGKAGVYRIGPRTVRLYAIKGNVLDC
ncbi:MAG: DUF927 domain-containing protein [Magnetococcales bacterium]|nr:DUF927 domain-containing protein [Magnetococcales bacterium]